MPIYDAVPDPEDQPLSARRPSVEDIASREPSVGAGDQISGRVSPTMVFNPFYTGRPRTPVGAYKYVSIDRQEIIRKIKSREDRSRPTSPEVERPPSSAKSRDLRSPMLSQEITGEPKPNLGAREVDNQAVGMQIERPRSALHRGDFRDKEEGLADFDGFGGTHSESHDQAPSLSTSPVAPWHPQFPAAAFRQAWSERRQQEQQPRPPPSAQRQLRSRAASNASLASTFVYQPPTSPLVHQSRPDTPPRRSSRSPDKQSRRHTFSPRSLQHFASALDYPASSRGVRSVPKPTLRKEETYPYQAHQPRRSLHSTNASTAFPRSPPRSALSSRRPSISSDAHSPLHHAPMVGSYEESILRGRMSTTPSKPLNFVAQIGVLGKGACRPNLRCPPHVTVPFPAVFYSYGAGARSGPAGGDQPSPYVGLVDLENTLPASDNSPDKRRQRLEERLHAALSDEGSRASSLNRDEGSSGPDIAQAHRRRRRRKAKRRSGSPKAPPGGCYRIPQQGQLQIVIKNPNKTAVKLFLVPYDLSNMEPGSKTFIRQRSYSAGPIIDMPLSSRVNLGTDRPEASLCNSEDPNERPVLRYLIHLHICCTGRGRYWLYKSIRIVFANRVPDGKEKLRNEIQLPEPRYSAYKPGRDSIGNASLSNTPSASTNRRVSDIAPDTPVPANRTFSAQSLPASDYSSGQAYNVIPPFQFHYHASRLPTLESRPASRQTSEAMDLDSERTRSDAGGPLSPTSSSGTGDGQASGLSSPLRPARRLEEAIRFERDPSREPAAGQGRAKGESLLSQRLKGLGM